MKKITISALGILLMFALSISCRKDNINGDNKGLILGSYITLGSTVNSNLDISNPTSTVAIKVKGSVGVPVVSINIYAATGDPLDSTKWVLIKNVPYADGVQLNVTTAELTTAFGATPLKAGKVYTLQNEVVAKDGTKYSANNTPTNFTSLAGYNMAMTWTATSVCAFVQADAIGTYLVVSDKNWQDFSVGDQIIVSAGPNDSSISFLAYPSLAAGGTNRKPWIVSVNKSIDVATMTTQAVGDYPGAPGSTASATGLVFSCTGYISLKVNITYGGSTYTNQEFILQKQ